MGDRASGQRGAVRRSARSVPQRRLVSLVPFRYELPKFLRRSTNQASYTRWLHRKATAHARRDRKRWGRHISISDYKVAIHNAVLRSNGCDYYTGERLAWRLISTYDNEASRSGRTRYKKKFALLPTVDHANPESERADFQICGWRTNDCKNDLSLRELRQFCTKFLVHRGPQ